MMEGIVSNAPYIAAVLGTTLGISASLFARLKDMRTRRNFYTYADKEIESALISADRVLKNGATPPIVRDFLLLMLHALATPALGRDFTEWFVKRQAGKTGKPGNPNDLSVAIDKLHVQNPQLGADVHRALMGILLALPTIYADEVSVREITGEGATNPESVFDRAAKAIARIHGGGRPDNSGGGTLAAC